MYDHALGGAASSILMSMFCEANEKDSFARLLMVACSRERASSVALRSISIAYPVHCTASYIRSGHSIRPQRAHLLLYTEKTVNMQ